MTFSILGRDFVNALAAKNVELFTKQLVRYLGGFIIGIPIFVFKSYFQVSLALESCPWIYIELQLTLL